MNTGKRHCSAYFKAILIRDNDWLSGWCKSCGEMLMLRSELSQSRPGNLRYKSLGLRSYKQLYQCTVWGWGLESTFRYDNLGWTHCRNSRVHTTKCARSNKLELARSASVTAIYYTYVCTVYDGMHGRFPANNTVQTPCVRIYANMCSFGQPSWWRQDQRYKEKQHR